MIKTSIDVYDDYVALTGDRTFNPQEWQHIYDYYEDEGITYDLDEEGPFHYHWTKYDSAEAALKDYAPDTYKELMQSKEEGEYENDDEYEDALKEAMDSEFEFYLYYPAEDIYIVKDPS